MGVRTKKRIHSIRFHMGARILGLLTIYPLLWLLASSLKSSDTILPDTYSLIPKIWGGVINYKSGFSGAGRVRFITLLMNSLVITVAGAAGCVITSPFAAYAFSRIRFRFSGFWLGCVILTIMVPHQAMVVPQHIILKRLHLIDTRTILVLLWFLDGAFFTFLTVQLFQGIPRELDETAEINGCDKLTILFRILIPIVKPTIVTSPIFAFYRIWQDPFQPLIFMSSASKFTIPLALNMYLNSNSYSNYGRLFAMSMISLPPVIVFFVIFQRYLVDGITTDGIKG